MQQQLSFSNAWTLPQDDFTVFYRFFRDKISWYEADAICQFHHANLVTGSNIISFFEEPLRARYLEELYIL